MWPFKKKKPSRSFVRSIPFPKAESKITVEGDKYFDVSKSKLIFAVAYNYTNGCFGANLKEGRIQYLVYKTAKNNYICVSQDIDPYPKCEIPKGEIISEKELHTKYFFALYGLENGLWDTVILKDELHYQREEV